MSILTVVKWVIIFIIMNVLIQLDFYISDRKERKRNNELCNIKKNTKNT